MKKNLRWLLGPSVLLLATSTVATAADWAVSGMLREEIAAKTGNSENINNWGGNLFNGVPVANTGLLAGVAGNGTLMRPASQKERTDFNLFATRAEINFDGKLTPDLDAHIKLRGYSDQIGAVEKAFRNVNMFEQQYGNRNGGTWGTARKDWMLDLPQAYLDYSSGPLWLRMGNQQIAWGEALFFRVADMANGLDLRRHLITDVASEEFSDRRISAPALRGIWRANEKTQVEGFVQLFRPSVIPNENSPYNIIPAQFIVDQKSGYDDVNKKLNLGFRYQGNVNNVGIQAFALRRNNPDGIYRWTDSAAALGATSPGVVPGTPFVAAVPGGANGRGVGVYSAREWFRTANSARLDGLAAFESALNEFPTTGAAGLLAPNVNFIGGLCGATGTAGSVGVNTASASCMLDTFFSPNGGGFGNLRGTLVREYKRESIFGFGLNTVFEGEPDSFTDQLIGRFELSYTPNKKFTNPSMSRNYIEKDETSFALIFEKYHKFSDSFPATYMVAQWMHKSASDIFGRSLKGEDNTPGFRPNGKDNGSNYFAFVAQQPSPTAEWRFDLAALTDIRGGWFIQPGAKWRPSKSFQLDIYGNYFKSDNDGKDFAENLTYAREIFVRGSYYF